MFDLELLREAAFCLQQSVDPRSADRPGVVFAMLVELLACRAQPPPPTRGAIDDLLGLQAQAEQRALVLIHRRRDRLAHRQRLALRLLALAALAFLIEPCASPPSEPPDDPRGPQMLGQLVAARLAVELVLLAIDPRRLLQDLPRDPP